MVQIGPYTLRNGLILAPMAGVTDLPFRKLCRKMGAGLAVSEMVISDHRLWNTRKSRQRLDHRGESEPRSVQIAGGDPHMMADAARLTEAQGAQIIDINMGCPAKKVCNRAAGSALLKDEPLVAAILQAVIGAVNVPVTLKMRTGWSLDNRNGIRVARIAEDMGIQAIAVHGRTRACGYSGDAEYDTIAAIKQAVRIPVFANGDIDSPQKAKQVLLQTGADGLLIGRAAQGSPWIFREIHHYLTTGETLRPPAPTEIRDILLAHVQELHAFYGDPLGARIARKHVSWYLAARPGGEKFKRHFNTLEEPGQQLELLATYFKQLINGEDIAA
jgi:tRNA-dihydrouridine synthase B